MSRFLCLIFSLSLLVLVVQSCDSGSRIVHYDGKSTFPGRNIGSFYVYWVGIEVDLKGDTMVFVNNGWNDGNSFRDSVSLFLKSSVRADTSVYYPIKDLKGTCKYDSIYFFKATSDEFGMNCFCARDKDLETFGVDKSVRKKLEGGVEKFYSKY